jgi:chaperonin GroEL
MSMRRGLERGVEAASQALRAMAVPVAGRAAIERTALALCPDQELARLLAEIFEIVGIEGYIQVESGQGRGLHREYVEGAFWKGSWASPVFISDPERRRSTLGDPAVLLTDNSLQRPEELLPALETVLAAGYRSLLIVCRYIADPVVGLLAVNRQSKTLDSLAVLAPGFGTDEADNLEDLAALTGARVMSAAAGDIVARLRPEDLGQAREGWASADYFGIVGGRGDPRALRAHIGAVRTALKQEQDERKRDLLRRRLGRLIGGVAKLRLGASTEVELEHRRAVAERTIVALRETLSGGILPGAGGAFLACQAAVAATPLAGADEAVALQVLVKALEAPIRTIAENAGLEPSHAVARSRAAGPGWGPDVRTGEIVELIPAGIVDPAAVVEAALRGAVSGAAMALTTDVLVHRNIQMPNPPVEP